MCEFDCKGGCGRKVYAAGRVTPPDDGLCEECRYVAAFPTATDAANDRAVRRVLRMIDEGAEVTRGAEG
jgi:hypothetical protein